MRVVFRRERGDFLVQSLEFRVMRVVFRRARGNKSFGGHKQRRVRDNKSFGGDKQRRNGGAFSGLGGGVLMIGWGWLKWGFLFAFYSCYCLKILFYYSFIVYF